MNAFHAYVDHLLSRLGFADQVTQFLEATLFVLVLAGICVLVNLLGKKLILVIVRRAVQRTPTKWDDVLLEKRFFQRLSHLAPVLAIYLLAPLLLREFPGLVKVAHLASNIYVTLMVLSVLYAFLDAAGAIYARYEIAKIRPIKGYLQVVKILAAIAATIFASAFALDRSPTYLFTGLGALMAVLLLVFKDSLLGFVAGVQVSANNLVRIGDWIEMPKYGADGDVIDISLHTVQIRNFDQTVTTIPTYALVSESFKNWRNMFETGGRRIKREVLIDINSIRACDEALLDRLEQVPLLTEYLREKRREVDAYNREHGVDPSMPVAGRRLTNVGTFRAYLSRYLRQHASIHPEMTCMVRHLAPGEKGLPLQIYAFTSETAWAVYEGIQADIFDHVLSVAPFFGLRVFQFPTGSGDLPAPIAEGAAT